MSPYPAQVSYGGIIDHARAMIEAEGVDGLSLSKLAASLGIKAPSLYRYVNSKTTLLRGVNEVTTQRLLDVMDEAVAENNGDARTKLMSAAIAYRRFAQTNPATYWLAFTNTIGDLHPDANEVEQRVLPLQTLMAQVSGEEHSLAALRGAMALIHGFVMLELSGQYRRGGSLDDAFTRSIDAFLEGWSKIKFLEKL
jgi:AcrR family transcriptional regulator